MKAILSILDVRTLVIVALVLFIVFKKNGCSGGKSDKEIVYIGGKQMEVIKRDTVVEEKTHYQTIYKPGKDIIHDSLIYVEVPAKVDTASLLKDYFARVPYEDIIVLDSGLGYVKVFDTISENRIFTRRWEAFVKERIIKEQIYVKYPVRHQFYFGGNLWGTQLYPFGGISAGLLWKSKWDQNIYQFNYGYLQYPYVTGLTPYVGVGAYFKLGKKE